MARTNIPVGPRFSTTGATMYTEVSELLRDMQQELDVITTKNRPIKEEKKEENLPRFEFKEKTRDGRQHILFESKYGKVWFYRSQMPSNCGIVIMSGIIFEPTISHASVVWDKKHTKEEYFSCVDSLMKEFDQELDTIAEESGELKNKIIMTDSLKEDMTRLGSVPSIHYFCKLNGWTQGKATYNRNSGNEVAVFERDRYDVADTRDDEL